MQYLFTLQATTQLNNQGVLAAVFRSTNLLAGKSWPWPKLPNQIFISPHFLNNVI